MDITYTLQRMCLQPTTQPYVHVMFLEYPATSLLPNRPVVCLRMEPPKAALYRETPNPDKYFLEEQGLDFFVRLPVQDSSSASPCSSETIDTAIDRLSHHAGRSILEAVTVSNDNYNEGGLIFRLTTTWHNSHKKEVKQYQMSESEWRDILNQDTSKQWTHLLQDLFSRASDRAYLHVERQLQGSAYSPIDDLKWNAYEVLDANRLLALNMRKVRKQGTLLCLEPIRDFYADENRAFTVRLPCEHKTTVCIANLRALSLAACMDATCPHCGRVILPNRDITYAMQSVERRRRQRKALDETLWKHLEARKVDREVKTKTSGTILCQALTHALKSMRVPESVSPRSVSPAWSDEAAVFIKQVRLEHGGQQGGMFPITLGELYDHLVRTIDAATWDCNGTAIADMSDQLFPGWQVFVRRWVKRTMALMTIPEYAGEDVWQVSGEVPDDDICFDDEEAVLGGDTDIGSLLGGVSLL
ncbi:hypothetical protein MBLNU13_g07461t1 [Cladosporium sp. NU13]